MGERRDPDATGAPAAAADAPALVSEAAPVDTSAAFGRDAAAAREAAAHYAKGKALYDRDDATAEPPAPAKATLQISKLPQEVVCPITQAIMSDPVMAADGFTYERAAITDWLEHKDTSPITGAALANTTLTPNRAVKKIAEWFMLTCEEAGADAEELC